jgi:hypothetical protein
MELYNIKTNLRELGYEYAHLLQERRAPYAGGENDVQKNAPWL